MKPTHRSFTAFALLGILVAPLRSRADDAMKLASVGHWSFDDAQNPLAYAGTSKSAAVATGAVAYAAGKTGRALKLGGAPVCVTVQDREKGAFDAKSAFSIECWADLTATTNDQRLVGKWGPSPETASYLLWSDSNGKWGFIVASHGQLVYLVSKKTAVLNEWHHLEGTWDGKGVLRLYVDGELQAEQTGVDKIDTPPSDFVIGAGPSGSGHVVGLLDEVSFARQGATPATNGPNLLANGDFETPALDEPFRLFKGETKTDGWTWKGAGGVVWNEPAIAGGSPNMHASQNRQFITLNNTDAVGGVSQRIATTPGQTYLLKFDLTALTNGAPNFKVGVKINAPGVEKEYALQTSLPDHSTAPYETHDLVFTAKEATSEVTFTSTTPKPFFYGTSIDNAQVFSIALVPTVAMLKIPPTDKRVQFSDYANIEVTKERARFDRMIDAEFGMRWDNPGARIRFRTDATSITANLFYNGRHNAMGSLNKTGVILVDGKRGGTFSSGAERPGAVDATIEVPKSAKPAMHLYEVVLPYGDAVDFVGLQVNADAKFETAPPRPRFRWVAYGDSITQGFWADDVTANYPFQVAQAKGWECVNMGFGGRQATPDDGKVIGSIEADLITVAMGFNDHFTKTPAKYAEDMKALLGNIRARQPKTPIYVLTLLWSTDPYPTTLKLPLEDYRAAAREVVGQTAKAGDANLHLIDGLDLVPHDAKYFREGIHPVDEGFTLMARNLIKSLPKNSAAG